MRWERLVNRVSRESAGDRGKDGKMEEGGLREDRKTEKGWGVNL